MLDSPITLQDLEFINHIKKNKDYYQNYLDMKNSIIPSLPLYWLGFGLAKISASYASDICMGHDILSNFNSALCYQRYQNCNMPILVTLGGKGDDIVAMAKNIAEQRKIVGLVTANPKTKILEIFNKNIVFSHIGNYPSRDKRFVNLNGIISLSVFCESFINKFFHINLPAVNLNLSKINQYCNQIHLDLIKQPSWQNGIIILGIGYNTCIEHTWKAILQESGVASVTWQDIKDYTHGDHFFVSLNKNYIFLLIENSQTKTYVDIFEERFSQICQVHRIKLSSDIKVAFWENLFYVSCLTNYLSHYLNYEGKRPPKNSLVYSWRGWGNL